jgi:hypothetical protein
MIRRHFSTPLRTSGGPIAAFIIATICAAGIPSTLRCQTPWSTGSGGSIYYNGGNVGIGTSNPTITLHIATGTSSSPSAGVAIVGSDSHSLSLFPSLGQGSYNGLVGNGDAGIIYSNGVAGTGGLVLAPWINGTGGIRMDRNGNVGIGTTTPQYPLSVNGTIQAKEVLVNTGWADYVFTADYRVKPLQEVAAFIERNHHLPGIPSEAEVKEKGVNLGEMQSKLLAKVEELTLQMIRLNEKNERLEQRLKQLEAH